MTRDELIGKVAVIIIRRFGDGNPKRCATEIISEIFDAMKEPTNEMILKGVDGIAIGNNNAFSAACSWQAMLNASPLAKEG